MPLKLRLEDPPDNSPYIPWGTWAPKPGKTAALPYVANDNEVWEEDPLPAFGLSAYSSGPFGQELTVTPSGNHTALFYLKLPPRYSGDNWRVAVYKIDPKTGQEVPNALPSRSPVYTAWKRVFIEKDRMFRRGGLLFAPDAQNTMIPAGLSSLHVFKGPSEALLDNLGVGDKVAIFDAFHPFEGPHEEAFIGSVDRTSNADYAVVTLVTQRGGSTPYVTQYSYQASPNNAATHYPDFSAGACAALGVVNSADGQVYDASTNQINGPGSCFYDADLRGVEVPFRDGYVEVLGRREGSGAVPYLPKSFFDANWAGAIFFSVKWFSHFPEKENYFQVVGASAETRTDAQSSSANNISQIMVQNIMDYGDPQPQQAYRGQSAANHELGHQFDVNPDNCAGHDGRGAWCSGTWCNDQCLMDPLRNRTDHIDRFDIQCLALGEPDSGQVQCEPPPAPPQAWVTGDGAIRREVDPK